MVCQAVAVYALNVSVAHLGLKTSPSCQPPSCHSMKGEVTITGRAPLQLNAGPARLFHVRTFQTASAGPLWHLSMAAKVLLLDPAPVPASAVDPLNE